MFLIVNLELKQIADLTFVAENHRKEMEPKLLSA